jgi:hypothetical protein
MNTFKIFFSIIFLGFKICFAEDNGTVNTKGLTEDGKTIYPVFNIEDYGINANGSWADWTTRTVGLREGNSSKFVFLGVLEVVRFCTVTLFRFSTKDKSF